MVGGDGDIKNIKSRDREDLNWVEYYHTEHRDTREPLYLRFEEAQEIIEWKGRQGSGVLHINCDILESTPQSEKRHTTPLSTFCWGWINDVRDGDSVPTDDSPGALVFFMGGYYRQERLEPRPVGLTLMTSLIYQMVDLYGRKVCPDEAGETLGFESNKRNDVEYLCDFFKTLVQRVTMWRSLDCVVDSVGLYESESEVITAMRRLITLVEDQRARAPVPRRFRLILTGPGPDGPLLSFLQEKKNITSSYYFTSIEPKHDDEALLELNSDRSF
ncbi:hypothetical protein JMJ77_0004697 [Colletotrichum scovillei]|uniref:Uncharacterized protein n=1 Tax=Colletotrichum scovillei TaxID=1209932 RepID=A0A9P7UK16_9PEZI|nr:hypothetical protein JMJ77_0004697 [Colletotrichum scovillei]KAG7075906.1 hypothetical protein JMJ76_0013180 [Colletotrichum scovillei]KAG7083019.1 hypothetical protein JMJ78_0008470 [Colletotrichum scovillei]